MFFKAFIRNLKINFRIWSYGRLPIGNQSVFWQNGISAMPVILAKMPAIYAPFWIILWFWNCLKNSIVLNCLIWAKIFKMHLCVVCYLPLLSSFWQKDLICVLNFFLHVVKKESHTFPWIIQRNTKFTGIFNLSTFKGTEVA